MRSIRQRATRACVVGVLALSSGCGSSGGGGGGGGTATLSGTILGPGSTGLPGAVVQVSPVTTLQLLGGTTTKQAVTDASGNFIILDTPTGTVHVHVDGSGVAGGTFASLEVELVIGAGAAVLPQPLVLPNLDDGSTLDVTVDVAGMTTSDAMVGDPMVDGFSLAIPTGTTITVDGSVPAGGMVAVNVTPVPAIEVPMPLPGTLNAGAFVTIQPPGAAFSPALSITLPNSGNFPLGAMVDIWSFDHGLGQWVNRSQETGNQGTVTDIGGTLFIVADQVITEGGWHSGVIDVDPACATTIAGQVFIEGSAAVPLANVLISLSTGQFDTTGADGRFSIPSVPAYDAALLPEMCMAAGLQLRALGPVSHGANLVELDVLAGTIMAGGTTDLAAFDMPVSLTGSLVGSVTDAAGLAADGMVAIAGPESLSVATSQGAFFASALMPGDYTATFDFPSKLSDVEAFTITANSLTSVSLVEPGGSGGGDTIIVHVVDLTTDGLTGNVAGACVTLVGASGAPLFRTSNLAGLAEFDDATAGPYTVTAQLDTPLVPSGTQRSAATVVGVNALGTPPTILVPFFDTGIQLPPVTTDATLDGTVQNVPAGASLAYQIAEASSGFFDSGPADAGFSASIPSGLALDVGVVAIDSITSKVLSGIFFADVEATPGQTLMLDFDFGSASAHPFDRAVDLLYTNTPAHPTQIVEFALGDLVIDVQPGLTLADPVCLPDLSRAKFVDFPAFLAFGTENAGLTFEESFCDQPLGLVTPSALSIPFISPPTITNPANNASLPTYGPGSIVQFTLGSGAGTGPGFNGVTFFHESKANGFFSFWDILVAPGTTTVTLPAVFPGKPMFAQGFAAVNVDTTRFTFPGFVFANFFDVNLPANVDAALADRVCGASRSHFFTVGLPLRTPRSPEFVRRVEDQPRWSE